ncbi:hypothetical protein [Solwaraspora sp. WMMA2065]|uniref:hypothetical protein n=1 Tax=Solwaraspora sp. WMMA2065 TaxID=3015166 RepID=UPI00259B22B1|nr:hypothetical protein [Solwaraspora sp. WMMA2065]WJK34190.1 hypothetical protein O7610_26815 [Solwaraspora sp. WMMA2065]
MTGEPSMPESDEPPTAPPTREPAGAPEQRRRRPSPWATAGPEGTWWHGGEPTDGGPAGAVASPAAEPATPVTPDAGEPTDTAAPADSADPDDGGPGDTGRPAGNGRPAAVPVAERPPGRRPLRRAAARQRRTRVRRSRRPATGIAWIVVVAAAAAFLGWVSAEPLWLAVGRGVNGTATVTDCTGDGYGRRCLGEFAAQTGFTVDRVRLFGVPPVDQATGAELTARMLHRERDTAYVVADLVVLHLRWSVGWGLTVLLGVLLVWGSGARRLATATARRVATVAALLAPVLLAAGFLATVWTG